MKQEQLPLWAKPWLSIPETQRLMSKCREWVQARIDNGDFSTVPDGARIKVHTQSVRDWVDKQTKNQRDRVGLKTTA